MKNKPTGLVKRPNIPLGIAMVLLPVLGIGLAYLFRKSIVTLGVYVAEILPPCPLYTITGCYCSGCGITRSILALARFDLLLSLRQNPFPLVFFIYGLACYIPWALRLFGFRVVGMRHKLVVLWVILGFVVLYGLVRNFIPALMPLGTIYDGLL